MASTTAMFTGLSGLNSHSRKLDVIGNNIANVNTTAFKSSRMLFSSQFARTFGEGTAPGATHGGSNPRQIGLGVNIAATQRDFAVGSITPTGDPNHLAIEGSGFFIVENANGELYTRSGAFGTNALNELVTVGGERVLGYGIDANFNLQTGSLTPLTIPIGSLSIAEATQNVTLSGNLNADGPLPSQGSRIDITGSATAGIRALPGAAAPPNIVQASNLLTQIEDPLAPGAPLFSVGQQLRLSGAEKGTRTLPDSFLTIDPTTTMQDYMNFLRDSLGIQTGIGANPDGRTPGVSLNPTTGRIIIDGNSGVDNDLEVATENLNLLSSTGGFLRQPFLVDAIQQADGESVQSAFTMFDSLGAEVSADIRMVLENKSTTGTTWRYYIDSVDDSDPAAQVATGTLDFDANGRLINPGLVNIQIDRANTGAVTPMTVSLNFNSPSGAVTAFADPSAVSSVQATFVDGFPFGTLAGFGIARDGTIIGGFDNGLTRTLGQVVLADFTNPEGLVDVGGNLYGAGPNSGTPVTVVAGNSGTGEITSGALELSNVDIGREFIDMILTSTGYTASSRVIRTADELFQQLLLLGQ